MKKYIKVFEFILKSLLVVSVLFIIYGVVRFVFSIVSESVNVPEGDAITLFWPFICAAVVFVLFQCLMFIFIRVVKSNGDNPNELKLFSKIRIDSYSAIFGNFENIKSSIIEYAKNNKYKEYAFDLVVNHNELYILEKKWLTWLNEYKEGNHEKEIIYCITCSFNVFFYVKYSQCTSKRNN